METGTTTSPGKRISLLAMLLAAAVCPPVPAGWYAENTEDGADIVSMELRYPRWATGVYFSFWNMQLLPQGGSFYGCVQSRARSDRPEDQDSFRPPTTWSFWSDPDRYGGGDVLRNVYMHPEVYASIRVQYGGEGTSGGCGACLGASWIQRGDWYRMVMRLWSPEGGSEEESFVGWWIKDVARNAWYQHGTYRVPTRGTGLSRSSGFLEGTGCPPDERREFHRRLGYYRCRGEWRKSDTVTVDVPADRGGGDEYRTVRLLEEGTVFSLVETCDSRVGRNLEPGKKHAFTVKQPAGPQLDPIEVTDARARLQGGQLAVSWEIRADSSPQLGYRIEVFDNPGFQGSPRSQHAARIPQVRRTRLDTTVSRPSVRLVVTDIYDREKAFPVPVEDAGASMPAMAAPAAVRPGMGYQYFEQTDGEPWSKLPDFDSLKPKLQGTARGLEADSRGDRSLGFAFRYRGLLNVPEGGFHTLVRKSCDGSRIAIDGRLVLEDDGLHSATERRATVALEKGWHRLECDWFRAG